MTDQAPILSIAENIGINKHSRLVLDRLSRDHKMASDCINTLTAHVTSTRNQQVDAAFIAKLIDPVIDAPDDFHHILERQAFRRAWYRSGRFLPDAFNFDGNREKVRSARERLVEAITASNAGQQRGTRVRPLARAYAITLLSAIEADESQLLPLLRRFLTEKDWRELADELVAYDAVVDRLRHSKQMSPN